VTDQTQRAAFEQMVLPHLDEAFNLARWLTGNRSDAQDVVQEAFLKAYKYFSSFRGSESRAWLLTIVRRSCWSWLRSNRSHQLAFTDEDLDAELQGGATVVALHPNSVETPESLLSDKETRSHLNRAVQNLPVHYREVIVLREIHELSYREIADIAGVPIGTVMSRLARGREALAKVVIVGTPNEAVNGL
jgi:RNA polymerase sigma-70 factor (ECF subfamily)